MIGLSRKKWELTRPGLNTAKVSKPILFVEPAASGGFRTSRQFTVRLVVRISAAAIVSIMIFWAGRVLSAYLFPCGLTAECPYKAAVEVAMHRTPIIGRGRDTIGVMETTGEYYPLESFDPLVIEAVVASEDRRFAHREGAWDARSILRAMLSSARRGKLVGGISTIEMQTARLLFHRADARSRRTVVEKAREIGLARGLLKHYGRRRMLELYLNVAPIAGMQGIPMAGRRFFGRQTPAHITVGEGALLARLLPAPSRLIKDTVEIEKRRQTILRQMRPLLPDSLRATIDMALEESVRLIPDSARTYSPTADFIRALRRNVRVASAGAVHATIDTRLQAVASREIDRGIARLELAGPARAARHSIVVCFIAIDNSTGEVRAWVGGRPDRAPSLDHCVDGRIRPGSALKPVLVAEAIQAGWLRGNERVRDVERLVGTAVRNETWLSGLALRSDHSASVSSAIAKSDNYLGALLGLLAQPRLDRLREATGLSLPNVIEPIDALGTNTISPVALAQLYATIANRGSMVHTTFMQRDDDGQIVRPRRVWSSSTASTVHTMLRGVTSRGGTAASVGAALPPGFITGGKTGTVGAKGKMNSELLFVGYYKSVTALLWLGCDRPCAVFPGTAASVSGRLWATILAQYTVGASGRKQTE